MSKPKITFKVAEKVYGTPLARDILFVYAELAKTGIVDGDCPHVYDGTKAFYATVSGKVVGFLTFHAYDDSLMLKTGLAWTDPKYRGKGIYQALYQKLRLRARGKSPRYTIQGVVNAPNYKAMQPLMAKLRRKLTRYVYEEKP